MSICYVSFDGDSIGHAVGLARLSDNVEELQRLNNAINSGNAIFQGWAESHGFNMLEAGGDEGVLEIGTQYLSELPEIRTKYQQAVGATVSVGIGLKISESSKALLAAKLEGKDRITFYTDEAEKIVQEAAKNPLSETQKIAAEYLNKAENDHLHREHCSNSDISDAESDKKRPNLHTKCLGELFGYKIYMVDGLDVRADIDLDFCEGGNPARYTYVPKDEIWIDDNLAPLDVMGTILHEYVECKHMLDDGMSYDQAHDKANEYEKKFRDEHHDIKEFNMGLIEAAIPEKLQKSELLPTDNLEQELHQHAQQYEEQQAQQATVSQNSVQQIKAQLASVLKELRAQAPIMEQLKAMEPNTYKTIVNLTQSVIALARGDNPMQKSEGKVSVVDRIMSSIQNAIGTEKGVDHCMSGDCYVASEALHHLLGGSEGGWTPMIADNRHWFLKHEKTGKVLDPLAGKLTQEPNYDAARKKSFASAGPSKQAVKVIQSVLHGPVANPVAKAGDAPVEQHLNLPVGSRMGNKVKVRHDDGTETWLQMGDGQILSPLDPAGHPVSARNPNAK